MSKRNESMMMAIKKRKTNRARRFFVRNGVIIVGSSDFSKPPKVVSIEPLETIENVATKITISFDRKTSVRKVAVLSIDEEEVFSEACSQKADKIEINPKLAAGSYKFKIELVNSRKLRPEFILKVNPQFDPELKGPLFAVKGEEAEISWKSEQESLVLYNSYGSVVKVKGTETEKYTYHGKAVFQSSGTYNADISYGPKKVTKTVTVLERYPQLYNMFPMCGVLTDEFTIELTFNSKVPRELISEISLNSVDLGEKYVFKEEQITQNLDVYYLQYDGKIFGFDPDFKLRVNLNDEQKTEIVSQNFTMYRPSVELNQAKMTLFPSEFVKGTSYSITANLNIDVDFGTPEINIYSFEGTKTTYVTVIRGSKALYLLNNISIPFFGTATFVLNSTGDENGVCCYEKATSKVEMTQMKGAAPQRVAKGQVVTIEYSTEVALDMNLVDSFVMVFSGDNLIIQGKYLPEKSSALLYVVEFYFDVVGVWYPYIRYKQIADFAYLKLNASQCLIDVYVE